MNIEQKVKIVIQKEKCKGCGLCVYYCPKEVLYMSKKKTNKKGYFFAKKKDKYYESCVACGNCFEMCGDSCIKIYKE